MTIQRYFFSDYCAAPEKARTFQWGAKIKRPIKSCSLAAAEQLIRDRDIISAAEYNTESHLIQELSYLWDKSGKQ